jgi:hypothetical protein
MKIDPQDGTCRSCGGELLVIDADESTMTVQCQNPNCQEVYLVEPDAFGDGAMTYYVGFFTGHSRKTAEHRENEPP